MKNFKTFGSKISSQAQSWAKNAGEWADRAADTIGELTDSKLHESGEHYCSWCFELHSCSPVESSNFSRNVYSCDGCGNRIVKCRVCDNYAKFMAKTENKTEEPEEEQDEKSSSTWGWDNQFCSVHSGTIANFEHLNDQLDEISDYKKIFERSGRNFKKIGTATACSVGTAAVIGPMAFLAAPAMGAAIGSSFYGLSGAAATSKGLAVLGGGAIASGGLGMAGGVGVVTATGAALGARDGGIISNGYFGDVDGFEIEQLTEGEGPTVVCINGFLNEGNEAASAEWLKSVIRQYRDNPIVHVAWESKRLKDIAEFAGSFGATKQTAWHSARIAGKRGLRTAAKKAAPLGWSMTALGLVSNPWSIACVKAAETGALLADLIARTDREYILIGHSLGARVAYFCMEALASKSESFIREAHLLGGAIDCGKRFDEDGNSTESTKTNWDNATGAVIDKIWNYHSSNDGVLKFLYPRGDKFQGYPIGRHRIEHDKVENVDVTDVVGGHSEYIPNLGAFLKKNGAITG
ncbi:DUF726 domain-containing protein [Marinobacter adhaerens]|uniref:DUF726 domain-containing protein n=1 Tax=Marinobacter adhaerens TaxID=1033846 RepID=A0A851I455_9GAMM|nr:DUF726 domain-containing protein [Marinobacter adhaerens]NWN92871.1 DUF726 domain-containing protein [Marinobacter adhaerens]